MEVNQLPTKVGPYYWRESDRDEWEMWHVLDNGSELTAHRGFNVAFLPDLGGQWLQIPPADELVELRAKAKMVDDGQEAWAVFHQETHEMVVSWLDKEETQEMSDNMNKMSSKHRYTCEPVTIIRNQKQK